MTEEFKDALDALRPPLDQYAQYAIDEALKVVQKADPDWAGKYGDAIKLLILELQKKAAESGDSEQLIIISRTS